MADGHVGLRSGEGTHEAQCAGAQGLAIGPFFDAEVRVYRLTYPLRLGDACSLGGCAQRPRLLLGELDLHADQRCHRFGFDRGSLLSPK